MADIDDDAGFVYHKEYSTTSIFYKDEETGETNHLTWRPTPIRPPLAPINLDAMPITLCASSKGLVVWHHPIANNYYVGNPFVNPFTEEQEDDYEDDVGFAYDHDPLYSPPRFHHPDRTHVVLAVHHPSTAPSPVWHMICAVHQSRGIYTFDTFSSDTDAWDSLPRIDLQDNRAIVPNSGIACGRIAYWLLKGSDGAPSSVLRYDHFGKNVTEIRSFLELPQWVPRGARMQLGRVGNRLGLVVVNQDRSRVELHTLQRPHRRLQNPWTMVEFFKVQLQDADPEWGVEDRTIICREMPRPIRFDSFKVELLFWVQGRVVLLQNSTSDPRGTYSLSKIRFRDIPAQIVDGVPHVCTSNLPREFLPFRY